MSRDLCRRLGCAISLACLLLALAGCRERRADLSGPPNLVLISLDTLRPDHLGCYGYERPTSPHIDALARTASLFRNAFSTAPKTPESHMSMFTSLYPTAHGVGSVTATDARSAEIQPLSSDIKTIAGLLRDRGYATAGIHGGGLVGANFGFDRGFDSYREGEIHDAVAWLEQRTDESPFFLFFHTYQVHDPYTPSPPFDSLFYPEYDGHIVHDLERLQALGGPKWQSYSKTFWSRVDTRSPYDVGKLKALYDGEIAELDASLQGLFEAIERRSPNTVIALVSDHGEEFGDHGAFRHEQIYDELLRVLLLIKLPGQREGRVVDDPVSLIDLAPTLLHALSVPPIDQFQGRERSWLADAPGAAPDRDALFSELPIYGYAVVRDGRWKLLSRRRGPELYDYRADRHERQNLLPAPAAPASEASAALERLTAELHAWQARNQELHRRYYSQAAGKTELDERSVDQLRALGYVE